MENTAATTETGRFIYVSRQPSSRFNGWEYYRSDEPAEHEDGELFDTWSDAYEAGSGAPYANPVGYDWEAVTVEEADRVWSAIDGRDGDCGFAAAFALAAERGDEVPTDAEFDKMADPDEWPGNYAWGVLHEMSEAHAAAWRRGH